MTRLEDELKSYTSSGITPMHMPGHKRNPGLVPSYLQNDITEIPGFDDLHAPSGILKALEIDTASVWHARSAILSVNGATAPILSSIMAASSRGKILIASNCHISVWHALELSGCGYRLVDPVSDSSFPFFLKVDPESVKQALDSDRDIRSVIITSPTYEGVVSDIPSIYKICKDHGAALIVDESHGAHLGLNDYFPNTSEADVVVKSIHKTLHAPTQTAVLLTYSDVIREDLIRHYMDVFESSSPSYILMSGISRVISDLKSKPEITTPWVKALSECRNKLVNELKHVKLFEGEGADPGKLVILTGGVTDGTSLAKLLKIKGIETEASFGTHLIAMTGIGDTEATLSKFSQALISIDKELEGSVGSFEDFTPHHDPDIVMPISRAVSSDYEELSKDKCIGKVSASYCYKYPPGIPVLIPGQRITEELTKLISQDILKVIRG